MKRLLLSFGLILFVVSCGGGPQPKLIPQVEMIVGTAQKSNGNFHAYYWTEYYNSCSNCNIMIDIGTLPNAICVLGSCSSAYGVNQNGMIVGGAYDSNGEQHAYYWTDGIGMIDIGTLGGANASAKQVNDNGMIVGWSMVGNDIHAFYYDTSASSPAMVDIGTLGGDESRAWGINNNGVIVGMSKNANGDERAFYYDTSASSPAMVDIGTLGGNWSRAKSINNNGVIVGHYENVNGDDRSFYYDTSASSPAMVDIGTLGGNWIWANDVNDWGIIVGGGENQLGETHFFTYDITSNIIIDEGTPSGHDSAIAYAISEKTGSDQYIVGRSVLGGNDNGFYEFAAGIPTVGHFPGGNHTEANDIGLK